MNLAQAISRVSRGVKAALLLWLLLTLCLAELAEPLLLMLPLAVGPLAILVYSLLYALAGEKSATARRVVLLTGASIFCSGVAQLPILRLQ